MASMIKRVLVLSLFLLLICSQAYAWPPKPQSGGAALANSADVDLPDSRDLRSIGLMLNVQWRFFDFDSWNIDVRGEFQMSGWYNETVGMEATLAAVARANMPLEGITPYAELGTGPALEAFDLPEQGTWFNFLNFVGVGLDISLDDGSWLEVGLRLRHISNANIDERNYGVNSIQVHIGYNLDWPQLIGAAD